MRSDMTGKKVSCMLGFFIPILTLGTLAIAKDLSVLFDVDGGISSKGAGSDLAAHKMLPCNAAALDPTFGMGGTVTTAVQSSTDQAHAVAIQPDGKIVAAGWTAGSSGSDFALVRYNPNGTLDTTFDGDGKLTTDVLGSGDFAYSVAIQPDGRIIAAGRAENGTEFDFALVRYNPNGSLDTSFGGDGKVTTSVVSSDNWANSVLIQPDGRIVAAGSAHTGVGYDFALVRYNPDGSLDMTFGGTGTVTTPVGSTDHAYSVVLQADGRIVVTGAAHNGSNYDFALVRYNPNGSLDTTFGKAGKVTTAVLSSADQAYSAAIQTDGKIVVAGYAFNGSNDDFALARYNTDGSLDTSFDSDGKVTTSVLPFTDAAHAVAIQADGKIIAVGYTFDGAQSDFAVVRYNPDGSLDTSFDGDGKVTTPIRSQDHAYSVAIQPDGRIVAAGRAYDLNYDFALARYGANCPSAGFESDIAPRPLGDGIVLSTDVTQMRRFATGLDTPTEGNEFQRADCAPRSTSGDGAVTAADVVQARRYATALDPVTPAAGPMASARPREEQPMERYLLVNP